MKYLHLLRELSRGPIVLALPVALALGLASCSETTAPFINEGGMLPPPPIIGPQQSLYSLSGANLEAATGSAADDAVRGQRWCAQVNLWFDPAAEICAGHGGQPPFGSVSTVDGDLVVAGGTSKGAPLVWTGPPTRVNPFPDSGDFTLEVRMKVDALAVYGTGLHVREWNPAVTEGSSNPNYEKVLVVWADGASGLWVQLLGQFTKMVSGSKNWHTYKLVHEAGLYTLFVDDVQVAGPVASDRRPTGLWLGNPNFMLEARDWTDWRLSQLTVTSPEPEITEIQVPVDVKPGSCPSRVNIDANGVVPVAIAGTADLDVSRIDASTLRLAGVAPDGSSIEDVTGPAEPYVGKTLDNCAPDGADGHADLTVKFSNEALAEAIGAAADGDVRTLHLTGNLRPEFGGTPIVGEDVIVVQVPKNVSVDVQPGACPSPVNMKAGGLLPVAIAGGEDLDVSRIDLASLRLEDVAGERSSVEDVTGAVTPVVGRLVEHCSVGGPDGHADLVVGFDNQAIAAAMGDAVHGETRTLHLIGSLLPQFGGTPIVGEDVVVAYMPLEVSIDVRPGVCPAPLNPKARGVLPVAIAGMDGVDLGTIEVASLRLEGVAADRSGAEDVTSPAEPFMGRSSEDCAGLGPDGASDLTLEFSNQQVAAALAGAQKGDEVTLTLTGYIVTESGRRPIVGQDVVVVVQDAVGDDEPQGDLAGQDVECKDMALTGEIGSVYVPQGYSCSIAEAVVRGDIKAEKPESLEVRASLVHGNIQITEGGSDDSSVRIHDGTVLSQGNLQIEKRRGGSIEISDVAIEKGNLEIKDNRISGTLSIGGAGANSIAQNLQLSKNHIARGAEMLVTENRVGGNLQTEDSKGPGAKAVVANQVSSNLQCVGNSGPFLGRPNQAASAQGQCRIQ